MALICVLLLHHTHLLFLELLAACGCQEGLLRALCVDSILLQLRWLLVVLVLL
jgi:hypothetical protein